MSNVMRAIAVRGGKGPAEALWIDDKTPKPDAREGQLLVKVKAFGLNRMDLLQREGHYPVPPQAGEILGVEFSGKVERVGPGKHGPFQEGDEVFGLAYGGAYAEYIAVNSQMCIHKPAFLSWEECAGIPETWITATQALFLIGEFKAGKSVLWHAGASGVSIAGIQLAVASGASAVYVTASSQDKIDFCVKTLGATAGFNYKTQNWSSEIQKTTSAKGVDIIIDFIGKDYFQGNLNAAARDGRIVNLGTLSGSKLPEGVDISAFIRKRLRFEGSSLRSRDTEYQGKLRDHLEGHLEGFKDGCFKVFIEKIIPWEHIVKAHEIMEKNISKGKIVCTIG